MYCLPRCTGNKEVALRRCRSIGHVRLFVYTVAFVGGLYVIDQLFTKISEELDLYQYNLNQGCSNTHFANHLQRNSYDVEDLVTYKKEIPLIWIGGIPRSGTTLMRVMMDAHPDVRCGEETLVLPRILTMDAGMSNSQTTMQRLQDAKITPDILGDALAAYVLTIISRHGEMAPRLCNKDPLIFHRMASISSMFPNSKFLFMVRDGRATCHSIISRRVKVSGIDSDTYQGCLEGWNRTISKMDQECTKVGSGKCYHVFYEQLVLHPRKQMEDILHFLDIPWNEMVLHHEDAINKTGGVSLSKREPSTGQVKNPVNTAALTSWVEHIPDDLRYKMAAVAPMLAHFGYDPHAYPPEYGQPDKEVAQNNVIFRDDLNERGLIGRIWVPPQSAPDVQQTRNNAHRPQ